MLYLTKYINWEANYVENVRQLYVQAMQSVEMLFFEWWVKMLLGNF